MNEADKLKVNEYKFYVPPTHDMGTYSGVCYDDTFNTYRKDALIDYNNARENDGLKPVKRMPNGTKYIKV